ncbi:MAG: transporter substrate-binding domain-containing protein [Oscillospiraceae bacterium]|nr:transporter substrate-binding domain-containing protein [Oscillospiraceae bacterium]
MKKAIIWILVIAIIAVGVWAIFFRNGDDNGYENGEENGTVTGMHTNDPLYGLVFNITPVDFDGETANDGFLTMGTNADFAPFEFASNSPWSVDRVDGIDVRIAGLIAEALGLELRVSDMDFGAIIPAVQAGTVDIGIAGMTITAERAENVNFTTAYYTASQVIIAREDNEIESAADLVGLRVGVVVNYTGDIIVSDMDGVTEIIRSNSGVESVLELVNGRVDAVVIDRAPAEAMIAQHQGLVTIEDSSAFESENYGMAIRLDNLELLNAVNAVLRQMIDNGYIDAISAAYMM